MDIERIGENKIRCALTEEEIKQMGFDIDEIIGNSETTQQFMRVVLGMVEEQEHINMDNISPMVKAELLQNHSMAITFGEENELSFKDLVDTMSHLVSQMEAKTEKSRENLRERLAQALEHPFDPPQTKTQPKEKAKTPKTSAKKKPEPMICALRFATLENMQSMSKVCFPGRVPKSSLYKYAGEYYLILDFTGFTKDEMRPFAFGTVEYDDGHYSDMGQIAHIMEQGSCIMKSEALQMLIAL